MSSPNANILFYSNQCKTCVSLIKLLKSSELLGYFFLFCVDGRLDKLPPYITAVPTMIVKNCNKPLVAEETFEWVNKIKFLRQNVSMSKDKIIQNNIFKNMMSSGGVKGYSDIELGSVSDKFSLTKSDAPALPQSFFGYKDEDKNTIFTAPDQGKLSDDQVKSAIDKCQERRDQQDIAYKNLARKKQVAAVINDEQQRLVESYKQNFENQTQQNQSNQEQMKKMQQIQQVQQMQKLMMMQKLMGNSFGNK